MINSPFTRWEGDDIHGRRPVLTSAWVNLDILFSRPADAPRHVIVTGLDLTGVVPGRLHGRFPSVEGDWYGIVNYEIGYADGRRDKLSLVDQFVPFTALRERR
ncbi:hypothetical protein BBK82_08075 [Lentzea guizhouensis]|uniref:Uncharacterized protein n=1 Tax=Lentzea guizhouensis TaxID=1586287 RepID=A0A1B2HEA3_9PSEU|nr:hypothetical protein [Lentzea guizhouensis]ANZ36032.1 hypothetical protein BBK82_08075 [Lentzea guizhouensis]